MSDTLYREQLLDIYKDPSNKGTLPKKDVEVTEVNPFCGDILTLQLKIKEGVIEDVAFDGGACIVTIASSALLTDELRGKTLVEAAAITKQEVLDMLGVELTTSRVKCATLILDALYSALKRYEKSN